MLIITTIILIILTIIIIIVRFILMVKLNITNFSKQAK